MCNTVVTAHYPFPKTFEPENKIKSKFINKVQNKYIYDDIILTTNKIIFFIFKLRNL